MPVQQFDSGFDAGLGRGGTAQLVLMAGGHPTYQDGDVMCAFNRRRIRCVHAEQICHVKHLPFNSDGLNDLDTLPEIFQKEVYQYKFERISATEVRRTDQNTLAEDVVSNTPALVDGKMQHMDVERFLQRRQAHPRHRIFGVAGSEVWYGGNIDPTWDKLTTIWQEIETRDGRLEADHLNWPATLRELSRFLIVSTNDFDDATAGVMAGPLVDETDPANPVVVSKRKTWIDWRNLRDAIEADVLDFGLQVDIRGRKEVHQEITNERSV